MILLQGLGPTAAGYAIQGGIKYGLYEVFKSLAAAATGVASGALPPFSASDTPHRSRPNARLRPTPPAPCHPLSPPSPVSHALCTRRVRPCRRTVHENLRESCAFVAIGDSTAAAFPPFRPPARAEPLFWSGRRPAAAMARPLRDRPQRFCPLILLPPPPRQALR